ncbi:MAG: hypothetical protein AB2417_17200 [Clostridiaceae bacterium]
MKNILELINKDGFQYAITIDCEGTNFDKNLKNNVENLERFLKFNSENGVTTILFITPFFADMLSQLNLVEKIKQYNVIFGLHIHPENLPDEINEKCSFIKKDEELLASYNLEEQKCIINYSMEYLTQRGIMPIQIYRGGYFSMNDDTAEALYELTDIRFESHNTYREQYKVSNNLLTSLPVYSLDHKEELRLEYFSSEKLCQLLNDAIDEDKLTLGVTHSYLLDPNDFHYERDNLKEDIHSIQKKLVEMIKNKE